MKKLLYGILAFVPLIEVILSLVAMIAGIVMMVMAAFGSMNISAALPSVLLWVGIAGIVLGILLCIVGAVVFTIHAKNNPNLDNNARSVWMTSLIGLVCFSFPVYWWKCIRKENS
ncbi:MAG: hypothetical protein E7284_07810 [Lachnospiraceae bacterium]|nr:hypothetical protein [Lachnospiraceae bacterium]